MREVTTALRALRRSPGVTFAAVLILGLGIGAATAMVSVFHAAVIRRLPVQDQERLAALWPVGEGGIEVPFTKQQFDNLSRGSRTLEGMAGFAHWGNYEAGMALDGPPVPLRLAQVTSSWFQILGASPILGRLLVPEDTEADSMVVLSYGTWQRKFGGDSSVIGKLLHWPLTKRQFTIAGVARPGLDYPAGTEVWATVGAE